MRKFSNALLQNVLLPKTFSPQELENKYRCFNCSNFAPMRRISGTLAISIWIIYLGLDFLIGRIDSGLFETGHVLISVRLGGSIILALSIAFSRSKRFETDENFASKIIMACCIIMGSCQSILILAAPFPYDFLYYFEGVLVALLFCFGIFHLNTRQILILLLTLGALLLISIWYRWTHSYSGSTMAFVAYSFVGFSFLLMFIIILIGHFTSIQLERAKRQSFYDQELLLETNMQLSQEQRNTLKARNVAEAAGRSKSEFLANMSHEIRTPMSAILGFCHLLLKTSLSAPQLDYLGKIESSAKLLLGIISDVLDFSKIEDGKLSIEFIPFSLDDVLNNISAILSNAASGKGLKLIIEKTQDVPSIFIGDPLRITQILLNISSNAIKFTDKGEVHVQISLYKQDENSISLMVRIRDTGIGISPEQVERLFHKFSQADGSISRRFGGTGLGLAISKELVELMGGLIGVDSEPGKGTLFWFTVCLGKDPNGGLHFDSNFDFAGTRLLIIDDHPTGGCTLKNLLEKLKLDADVVNSGSVALAALQKADENGRCYDLVLIDGKIGDVEGTKLVNGVWELQLPLPPQLVVISDNEDDRIYSLVKNCGISKTLYKPVTLLTLQECFTELLGGVPDISLASRPAIATDIDINQLDGVRILLAEDDQLNREVLQRLLGDKGVIVEVAINGQIAIDKALAGNFDLILMDMQMPIVDGISAARQIRQSKLKTIPEIIALSANIMQADRQLCFEAGMSDFITKPINIDQFWVTLIKHLPGR